MSDEAIASTGDIGDVTGASASVSEHFAKASDMDAEIGLLHSHIRPDSRDQLLASDDFSGSFDQSDQDIERAAAQLKRLVRLLKQPLRRKQTKWAK
jgi:hypothetical protein